MQIGVFKGGHIISMAPVLVGHGNRSFLAELDILSFHFLFFFFITAQ
jgi:hypothetical protein